MANISAIKLPNGTTYDIKDNGALQLTGGQVTGPVTFGDAITVDEATIGDLVVNGSASFTNNIQANTINGVAVGSSPKFTDTNTEVSTLTLAAGSTAGTALTSGGKFTLTAGSKTVSFTMPTIPTIPSNNITGSGTNDYLVKFNGTNTITNGPQLGSSTTTFLRNDGSWATPTDTNNAVTQTATTTDASYEILFSSTADNTTRTEGARKTNTLTYNPSTKTLTNSGRGTFNGGITGYSSGTGDLSSNISQLFNQLLFKVDDGDNMSSITIDRKSLVLQSQNTEEDTISNTFTINPTDFSIILVDENEENALSFLASSTYFHISDSYREHTYIYINTTDMDMRVRTNGLGYEYNSGTVGGNNGYAWLEIGNGTRSTYAGWKRGIISLYGIDQYYVKLVTATLTANREINFPDKAGTIALTSDIPTKTSTTATLSTTWTSNQQTVTVSGVTTSNTIIVTPAPASYNDYCEAGIYCSAQAANSLTFKCEDAPSSALTVNILILN